MKLKIAVQYKEREFNFEFGSEAYIFHTGLYKTMDTRYSIGELLDYVDFTQRCYLEDRIRTNLGALADYIADEWDEVKALCVDEVLERFYKEDFLI